MKRAAAVLIPLLLVGWLAGITLRNQRHARLSAALIQAVGAHDAPGVEHLLASGADPDVRDWKTYFPGSGTPFRPPWYEKCLALALRRKPRVAEPYLGPTVLMIATDHGDTAIARSLLSHGADAAKTGTEMECYDKEYPSLLVAPLWEAVKEGKTAAVTLLLHRHAPVDERGRGLTPLLLTDDLGITQALIDGGADVNAVDQEPYSDGAGRTQLARAIQGEVGEANHTPHLPLARLLLDRGANVDARDGSGRTPLMDACEIGSVDAAKLLLRYGADPNARAYDGLPVLFCSLQNLEVTDFLLAHGADVNARDQDGRTALMEAAGRGDTDYLAFLLAHGAAVNAQDNKGKTALMLTAHLDYSDAGTDWQQQRRASLRLLRKHGANPSIRDKHGRTAAGYFNAHPPKPLGAG